MQIILLTFIKHSKLIFKMASYTRKAFIGLGSLFLMYGFGVVFGFLFRVLLTKKISVTDYGLYYSMFSFFSIAFILTDLGLQTALTKYIPEWLVNKQHKLIKKSFILTAIYMFIVSTIIIFIIWILSDFLQMNFFKEEGIAKIITLYAVAFALTKFESLISIIYLAHQKTTKYALIGILKPFLLLACTFAILFYTKKALAPTIGLLSSTAIVIIFAAPFALKHIPFGVKTGWSLHKLKPFTTYALFVFASAIGGSLIISTDSFMLTLLKSVEYVGLYNAALPIANLITYIGAAISTVTLPMFSELIARKLTNHIKEALFLLYKFSIILTLPAVVIFFTYPELLIRIIFGESYTGAAVALQILVWGTFVNLITAINITYINALGKPAIVTKIISVSFILNIILNLALIPYFGIVGAATATAASFLTMTVLSTTYLRRYVKVNLPLIPWIKNIICCGAMILIINLLKKLITLPLYAEAAIVLISAGIVYVTLVFALRIINIQEIKELVNRALR